MSRSTEELISALADPDLDKRRAAVDELAARGEEALPALLEELKSPDPKRRRWAVTAIGKMGAVAASATMALVEQAADRNEKVAKAAVRALRRFGRSAREAGPILVKRLDDRDARHASFLALVTVDPDAEVEIGLLVEGLVHRRFEVRSWAQKRLIALGEPMREALEEMASRETRDRARAEIRKVLKKL